MDPTRIKKSDKHRLIDTPSQKIAKQIAAFNAKSDIDTLLECGGVNEFVEMGGEHALNKLSKEIERIL